MPPLTRSRAARGSCVNGVPSDFGSLASDVSEKDAEAEATQTQTNKDDEEKRAVTYARIEYRKSNLRVRDIERQLQLSAEDGRRLHNLVRNSMKTAGILGSVKFVSTGISHKVHVVNIIETAKKKLPSLQRAGVPEARLNELLCARVQIVNDNEKHNDMMVRSGRVRARAGHSQRAWSPSEVEAEDCDAVVQPNRGGTEDHIAALPSLMLKADTFQFYPIIFLIRVDNSEAGAAVHVSQLATEHRHSSVTSIDDVSYNAFIKLVSHQVGFDVHKHISAVAPKNIGCEVGTADVLVKLSSEKEWKAMLQLWHNARRKTCEFVVDKLARAE